jgi:uncharacterized protein (TIGR03790 family)
VTGRKETVRCRGWSVRALAALCLLLPTRSGASGRPISELIPHLIIVENTQSADSVAIGAYYALKRHIPAASICRISCPTTEDCAKEDFDRQIRQPIQKFIRARKPDVDFIVLTKGIPTWTHEGAFSVDSMLVAMDWTLLKSRTVNSYFSKDIPFSHARFNEYLVTRLDGYTRADCLRLVDDSLAARPTRGPFLLITDVGGGHASGGYKEADQGIRNAARILTSKRLETILDPQGGFVGGYHNLMGYFSWGSNDYRFNASAYHSLGFVPGAIAETAVSTSGRTFRDPNAKGQSLIADLIAQGVTGCKGYVSEPFVDAIACADILFDRYTSGYTLAESFYMATRYMYWKDVVIGDPLCEPYAR